MNTSELARRDKFQFSMLLNDKRYRSYTFQFFALFILICAMAYLGKNLLENLAAAGLNISYSFLGEPSGCRSSRTNKSSREGGIPGI